MLDKKLNKSKIRQMHGWLETNSARICIIEDRSISPIIKPIYGCTDPNCWAAPKNEYGKNSKKPKQDP